MSESIQEIDYPDSLESFEKEVKRYKPIDMIDFCSEYFECLQKGIPLRSKDLSGLKKFHLTPEDQEVIKRLKVDQINDIKNQEKTIWIFIEVSENNYLIQNFHNKKFLNIKCCIYKFQLEYE